MSSPKLGLILIVILIVIATPGREITITIMMVFDLPLYFQ